MGQTITETPPGLITAADAARLTGIAQRDLWDWAKEGRITKVQYNGQDYFTTESVSALTQPIQAGEQYTPQVQVRQLMDLHREAQRYFDLGVRYFILGMQSVQEAVLLHLVVEPGAGQVQQALDLFSGIRQQGLVR